MDTDPQLPAISARPTRPWRPFGDRPPLPPPRRRAPAPPLRAPTPPRIAFPLWLPTVVALLLGGIIWLVVGLQPEHVPRAPRTPVRPPAAASLSVEAPATATESASVVSQSPVPAEVAPAVASAPAPLQRRVDGRTSRPRRAFRAARTELPSRPFRPQRVGDLKSNPYGGVEAPSPGGVRWPFYRKVPDLKPNPY